jgi:hypothetical protein
LRAKQGLFFTPISHNFQIQIRYAVDNKENLTTQQFGLEIRAAFRATIIGGTIGGLLGALSRVLGEGGVGDIKWPVVLVSGIFGAVAVVSFARKASAQKLVSVEDFWGGLLVGFLCGYLAERYFRERITGDMPSGR